MPFDPSVIAEIGKPKFDPAQSMSNALTLKGQMVGSQVQDAQLATLKREAAADAQIRELGKTANLTTEEGRQRYAGDVMKVDPTKGIATMREMGELTKNATELQKSDLEVMEKRQQIGAAAVTPLLMHAYELQQKGVPPEQADAELKPMALKLIDGLAQTQTPAGKPLFAPEEIDHMKSMLDQGNVASSLQALAMASQNGAKTVADLRKTMLGGGKTFKMADGVYTMGPDGQPRRLGAAPPPASVASQTAGVQLDPQAITDMAGQLIVGTAPRDVLAGMGRVDRVKVENEVSKQMRAAGYSPAMVAAKRLVLRAQSKAMDAAGNRSGQMAAGVEEIKQFAPLALQASIEVPRAAFVPYNKLAQMGEASISDPKLAKFYAATQSLLNAYDTIAARGGTDADKREHNRQMLSTAQSPEAYDTVVRFMMKEADAAERSAQVAMQPGTYNPSLALPDQPKPEGAPMPPQVVGSKEAYDALPPGTPYVAPDGSHRVKQ